MKYKTPTRFGNYIHQCLYDFEMLLASTRNRFRVENMNHYIVDEKRPIIFAVNHSNSFDFPITLKAIGGHGYVLIGKQRLWFSDRIFFFLNGVISVDRKDKKEMHLAKDRVKEYLKKNYSIIWYPEGTWNLTENRLMLPMKWGIVDVARSTNAQIVPMALEYDRKAMVCYVKYGQTIIIDETIDNDTGIHLLRDRMASLRYEMWEKKGIIKRRELDIQMERENLMQAIEEYPPLDWEYEKEIIYWGR